MPDEAELKPGKTGSLSGCACSGYLANLWGRRRTIREGHLSLKASRQSWRKFRAGQAVQLILTVKPQHRERVCQGHSASLMG